MVKVIYLNCALVTVKFPILKKGCSSPDQLAELMVGNECSDKAERQQACFFQLELK